MARQVAQTCPFLIVIDFEESKLSEITSLLNNLFTSPIS